MAPFQAVPPRPSNNIKVRVRDDRFGIFSDLGEAMNAVLTEHNLSDAGAAPLTALLRHGDRIPQGVLAERVGLKGRLSCGFSIVWKMTA